MRPWLNKRCVAAALAVLVVVTASCGGESQDPEAQPADDPIIFVEGDFGQVPVHPLADPVGEKSRKDDVTAQSFEVRNLSRDQLFDWYADNLDGWRQEVAPAPVGAAANASWRAIWTRADKRLIVTAAEGSTLSGSSSSDDVRLQYSLSLEPADRPLPTG